MRYRARVRSILLEKSHYSAPCLNSPNGQRTQSLRGDEIKVLLFEPPSLGTYPRPIVRLFHRSRVMYTCYICCNRLTSQASLVSWSINIALHWLRRQAGNACRRLQTRVSATQFKLWLIQNQAVAITQIIGARSEQNTENFWVGFLVWCFVQEFQGSSASMSASLARLAELHRAGWAT